MSNPILIKLLEHSSCCSEEVCVSHGTECKKMKQLIKHILMCTQSVCVICKDMNEVIFAHAQSCKQSNCTIHKCIETRESTEEAYSMLKSYSTSDLRIEVSDGRCSFTAPVSPVDSDSQMQVKPRGVYKCGQCGMPKIRPHKCVFKSHGGDCEAIQVSPPSPGKLANGSQLQNPHWNTQPTFKRRPADLPMSTANSGRSVVSNNNFTNGVRAIGGNFPIVSPHDLPVPFFSTNAPKGSLNGTASDVVQDVVLLPTSSHSMYESRPDVSHDIIYKYHRNNKLKLRKSRSLNKQMAKSAAASEHRSFGCSTSDSDGSTTHSTHTGWSQTVHLSQPGRSNRQESRIAVNQKRSRCDSYRDSHESVNMHSGLHMRDLDSSDPYGIRRHLREVRRQVAVYSQQHSTEEVASSDASYSEEDSEFEENRHRDSSSQATGWPQYAVSYDNRMLGCASLSDSTHIRNDAGCPTESYDTNTSTSLTTNVNRISLNDMNSSLLSSLPCETEQRPYNLDAALPCETSVIASASSSFRQHLSALSSSPITLVAKPPNKLRRLSAIFAGESETQTTTPIKPPQGHDETATPYRHSPSPVWSASSPDLAQMFRRSPDGVDDDDNDEEVFKYLNDDLSWMGDVPNNITT